MGSFFIYLESLFYALLFLQPFHSTLATLVFLCLFINYELKLYEKLFKIIT
jgi:hypothetical protein